MDDAIEFFEAVEAVLHEVRGRAEIAGGVRGPVRLRTWSAWAVCFRTPGSWTTARPGFMLFRSRLELSTRKDYRVEE